MGQCDPRTVDIAADACYGVLFMSGISVLLFGPTMTGFGFVVGAMLAYAVHVAWKMARFDPEWMTTSDEIESEIEDKVEDEVDQRLDDLTDDTERTQHR